MKERTLVVALLAIVLVPSASATESTIVRGVGIGKIKVGMTLPQVRRALGGDSLVNEQATVGTTRYLELGWDFSTFSVGFLKQHGSWRVAQVETTLRGEKTTKGIGVGSSFRAAARAYPEAICGGYYTSMGSTGDYTIGPGRRNASTALIVAKDRRHLAFLVHPSPPRQYRRWAVYAVIVRNTIAGAVDFPSYRCRPGWQQRGTP